MLKLLRIDDAHSRTVTEEEISASLVEGVDAGLIEAQEHLMVRNVFHLDDRSLSSLMVPHSEIEWLKADLSAVQALDYVASRGETWAHSWYPVCEDGLDTVIGMISVPRLLELRTRTDIELRDHVSPVEFIPETLSAMEMLEQLRNKSGRLSLVVDEYGIVQGLLTPRDLLEAITGELKASVELDAWAIQGPDGSWRLDGLIPASELKARLDIASLPLEDKGRYHTLAGLLMAILGRLPMVGEQIDCAGWVFTIRHMEGRRIDQVLAERMTSE